MIPGVTTDLDDTLAIYGLSFDGGDGYPFSVLDYYHLAKMTLLKSVNYFYVNMKDAL